MPLALSCKLLFIQVAISHVPRNVTIAEFKVRIEQFEVCTD